jgi:CrcB protein
MIKFLIVGLGGFFGSIGRYALHSIAQRLVCFSNFPVGTLTVNVVGCFLAGLGIATLQGKGILTEELRLLLVVGFLGGFTTFSAFGFETTQLFQSNQNQLAILNIMMEVVLGIFAVMLGLYCSKFLHGA